MNPSPSQLDNQSPVKIVRWLDIDSNELNQIDNYYSLTKKWLAMLLNNDTFKLDSLGRVWGFNKDKNQYYPYHIEYNNQLIGIKVSKKAAN